MQVSTTKGTGGDLIILEVRFVNVFYYYFFFLIYCIQEAAYVDPGFFYETVAPLLCMEKTSMLAISTLTSDTNFYSRLIRMRDKVTGRPLFSVHQVRLACEACIDSGKAAECVHMLHLVPK